MTQEKLLHGWDDTNKEWVKLQVDANGYVKVDLSSINLNDLADLDASAPADEDVLTWDNTLSKWVPATAAAGGATVILKTGDESLANSTTLQNDAELLLPLLAGEAWEFTFTIIYFAQTTPDIKFSLVTPALSTIFWGVLGYATDLTAMANAFYGSGQVIAMGGRGGYSIAVLKGVVANGVNAGNLQLQWAQNVSDAAAVWVYSKSNIVARLVT